jgi:hypothetical protein
VVDVHQRALVEIGVQRVRDIAHVAGAGALTGCGRCDAENGHESHQCDAEIYPSHASPSFFRAHLVRAFWRQLRAIRHFCDERRQYEEGL